MTHWTDERVETLKTLWLEGHSATQIARTLGVVTRNAVIGKIHRLGLAARDGMARSSKPRLPRPPRAKVAGSAILPTLPDAPAFTFADGTFVTLASIDNRMCRWPCGDPAASGFHFCGHPVKSGSPYCETHTARAHQPARKARTSAPAVSTSAQFW